MIDKLPDNLIKIIEEGENTNTEFKKSNACLPSNLFESICAMLNRNGGNIFLGVEDDGIISGVDEDKISTIKKNFVNLCNNPEKIFPTVHLEIKDYSYNEKIILHIYVYESSDVHRTANIIYDRNEDGDFDITNNTTLVSDLYVRKRNTYTENTIYPYVTMDNLRVDLIHRVRIMANNRVANHLWSKLDDMELLKSASLYEKNYQTGEEGFNLACILLFGKDEVISSILSYYKTDAILKVKDYDRYDDRDDIRTNLIESYDRLITFMQKHLNDKFYIENEQRINIRDIIARELCTNLLIHREYSNPFPSKLIITKNEIRTENANKPRMIGYIDVNNFSPYPKNPKIAKVFKEIGLVEELGSGIRKINKYVNLYNGFEPKFKEGEIFEVEIPLTFTGGEKNVSNYELRKYIFDFINSHDKVSRRDIDNYLIKVFQFDKNKINNKVRTSLTYLKNKGKITNIGTDTNPEWIVCKPLQ